MATSDPSAPAPLDILQADRLYEPFPDFASWKGLTEADLDLWDRFAKGLETQRAAAPPEAFGRAVQVAMRAAAIDTGAIEGLYDVDRGFTMSVATQAVAWEHAVEEKGADVRALFEAQLEAYELVLDAATKSHPVHEVWLRQLHEVLCRAEPTYKVLTPSGWQEHELIRGQYKTLPNHVRLKDGRFHAYAPVDRVPQEMHRLVEILTSPEFDAAHPILQASYAHYALVNVHPFADGNGRVARALASMYFYRAVSIPLVIFSNQKTRYIDALNAADGGLLKLLIAFIRDRGIDTMQLLAENLRTEEETAPETVAAEIGALRSRDEIQLGTLASRLVETVGDELRLQVERLGMSEISLARANSPKYLYANLISHYPAESSARRAFHVAFSKDPHDPFRFRLESGDGGHAIEVRLEDVSPELTASFHLRLSNWIKINLSQMLEELRDQAKKHLESST